MTEKVENEQRELWRARWLSSIAELTSLALQSEKWLDSTNTNPHWSYIEFTCCYFDDTLAGSSYQNLIDEEWVSKSEYDCIKDWHEAVDAYHAPNSDDYDNLAVLQDSKWRNVVAMGAEAGKELLKLLNPFEAGLLKI